MTKRIKNIPSFSEGASMNHGIPHQTPSSPGKKGLSMDAFFFQGVNLLVQTEILGGRDWCGKAKCHKPCLIYLIPHCDANEINHTALNCKSVLFWAGLMTVHSGYNIIGRTTCRYLKGFQSWCTPASCLEYQSLGLSCTVGSALIKTITALRFVDVSCWVPAFWDDWS